MMREPDDQIPLLGPWTREQEDELLVHYKFRKVEGLEDAWQLVRPGPKQGMIYARREALDWISAIRRTAHTTGG
jgi:hypothetical protein